MNKIIDSIDCQVVQLHMIRCFLQPFRRLHDVIRDMSATERAIRASRVSLFSFSVSENWKKHVDIEMREHKEQSERNEEKKREPKRQQKKRKKRRKKRSLVMDERKKKGRGDTTRASEELFSLFLFTQPFLSILITKPNAPRGVERAIIECHAHNEEIYCCKRHILIISINLADFRLIHAH